MSDEEQPGAASVFFLALMGFALTFVPLVATLNSAVFDGALGTTTTPIASLALAVPPALEFAFSGRDPYTVGKYVGVFVVLYFLAIVGQAVVYVAAGRAEPVPVAELVVLFATYALTYALVYRGGLARLRRSVSA